MKVERTFTPSSDLLAPGVKDAPIVLVGAGGIGSFTALALVKMGFTNVTVYDADTVEVHNLDNQLYGVRDIGRPKVSAMQDLAMDLADIPVTVHHGWFTGAEAHHNAIVILAVDSITARNDIWSRMKLPNAMGDAPIDVCRYFIDCRMGAEIIRLFTANPMIAGELAMYEQSLHPAEEAVEAPCTAKSIMYTPFVAGGLVAAAVKKFLMGARNPQELTYSFATNEMRQRWLHVPKTQELALDSL